MVIYNLSKIDYFSVLKLLWTVNIFNMNKKAQI